MRVPVARWWVAVAGLLAVILPPATATLSPAGINYEGTDLLPPHLRRPHNLSARPNLFNSSRSVITV
jgi:hypothetical protein